MTDEDADSLLSLRDMCATANLRPVPSTPVSPVTVSTASPVTVSTAHKESGPGPANIFDLNNLLLLALQIEDQIKYNESELIE